jgi:acyl-CoA synthetase (AMP-forming)/AMP-acid ligase II
MMSLADLLQTGSANLNNFALVHDTEGEVPPISYGDLHQACKTIADKLHLAGLASGDVVALVAPHSIHSAATMIGLVRCGLVCAPVDPATSSKRFKEVLEETGAKMLLVGHLISVNFVN